MQVPAFISFTVVPLILQIRGVLLLNVTVKPDVAVAFTVPVEPLPFVIEGAVPKVMVWDTLLIVMVCVTCGAAE